MPKGQIPEAFYDLLASKAFAFVSTLGKTGEPQVNPVWFLWTGTHIQIGLMAGTQKYVNLVRDPRIAIAIAHPDNPYRYLEVRGRSGPSNPTSMMRCSRSSRPNTPMARSAWKRKASPGSSPRLRSSGIPFRTPTASRLRRDGSPRLLIAPAGTVCLLGRYSEKSCQAETASWRDEWISG